MSKDDVSKVHIKLQRVQTWLFSVPRLRAMVGANTLLGEVLRIELPDLAGSGESRWALAPLSGSYPSALPDDPLRDHDDPAADARRGILSRDGGHFEAMFSHGAEDFADAAATLLRRKLPGLRFRVSVDRLEREQGSSAHSTELPVFAPCQWTGRGLASLVVAQGTERATVSLDVSGRHEAARRAEAGKASDLASLLAARTRLQALRRPPTFEHLAGDGYLAVIHADGNDVGASAGTVDEKRAVFFHSNRVLLRRSLHFAIDRAAGSGAVAPLLPLMLGGDDLLVICKAASALPFVIDLCDELERLQASRSDQFHLTLGVGAVFSQPKVPFHRLHAVAENLAASAKRRVRSLSKPERYSVVDWAVYTTAWIDDPAEVRRRDWVRGPRDEERVLSRRPVPVLGTGLGCLKGLVEAAAGLVAAPRSQLRYLVDQMPRGKVLSELAFAELSKDARQRMDQAGVSEIWSRPTGGGPYLSSVLDLVEVAEIGRLGRAGTAAPAGEEVEEVIEEDEESGVGDAQA